MESTDNFLCVDRRLVCVAHCISLLLVISADACSQSAATCVPGASTACSCLGGRSGVQVCQSNGTYAACDCDVPDMMSLSPGDLTYVFHPDLEYVLPIAWATRQPMPTSRFNLGVATVGGLLYAIGGDSGSYLSVVEAYDPSTDAWTTRAPMPTARAALAVATANGKIYAIGGVTTSDPNVRLSTVNEEYDPVADTWKTRAPMPSQTYQACGRTAGAAVNDKVYIWPGQCSFPPPAVLLEYDPSTDKWATKAALPGGAGSLTYNQILISRANASIFAFSQQYSYATAAEYSPGNDAWTTKPPVMNPDPPTGNAPMWTEFAATTKRIYAFGAQDTGTGRYTSTALYFDGSTSTWLLATPFSVPIELAATASIGSDIYVVGGAVVARTAPPVPVNTLAVGVEMP